MDICVAPWGRKSSPKLRKHTKNQEKESKEICTERWWFLLCTCRKSQLTTHLGSGARWVIQATGALRASGRETSDTSRRIRKFLGEVDIERRAGLSWLENQ